MELFGCSSVAVFRPRQAWHGALVFANIQRSQVEAPELQELQEPVCLRPAQSRRLRVFRPSAQSPAARATCRQLVELRCRVSAGAHGLRKDRELHAMQAWVAQFGCLFMKIPSHTCAGRTPPVPVTEPVTTLAEPTAAWRLLSSDLRPFECQKRLLDRDATSPPRTAEFGDPFFLQVASECAVQAFHSPLFAGGGVPRVVVFP